MNLVSSAVFLTVTDPAASSRFFTTHLGFREVLVHEDFVELGRDDAGVDLVLVRRDLEQRGPGRGPTDVMVSFAVTGIAAEYERLRHAGVGIAVPLRQEPWGELVVRLVDPNGVAVQLTEWVPPTGT
ncbi:catechol 2,3-dioxygenase-like lactoylglutathione lyase family enzyme [Kitasatospora sp. MAA19]|uniref:VOC family protein n=1 Tax=Kitasatospora sp. MAA19 TaxID=3035090 RepID=UPI002473480F|nr:VOC family protein [Kitasatospora sp. MAA19]MDH6705793.1 catechol 2,3-dioxygenase-like lactoylglutathione lyase family enzyme [Kitasatospora sp. MAA19]